MMLVVVVCLFWLFVVVWVLWFWVAWVMVYCCGVCFCFLGCVVCYVVVLFCFVLLLCLVVCGWFILVGFVGGLFDVSCLLVTLLRVVLLV